MPMDPTSQISNLLSIMEKLSPQNKVAQNPDAREALKQIAGLRLLNERLGDVENLKAQGGIGTNTGPMIGRWNTGAEATANGQPSPPGFIGTLMSMVAPKESNKRSSLERMLKIASQYAFDIGGKQLTGTEAVRSDALIPNMFTDEPNFESFTTQARKKEIPRLMDQRLFFLKQMGIDDHEIRNALQEVLGQ